MSKFKGSAENGYTFEASDGYTIDLNQDNFCAFMFRDEEWFSRLTVEDDRDGLNWSWWRDSTTDEVFERIVEIAFDVGTVVVRSVAPEAIVQAWDEEHEVLDTHIDQFFSEETGNE